MRSTRWKVFGTARFLQRSQKPASYRRFVSPLQRVPGSLHRQFDTTGSWTAPLSRPVNYNLFSDCTQWLNSSKLRLVSITPSVLQATAAHGACRQVVVNNARSVNNDTSIMTTWVKGCELSTIRPTWVKGCQLLTILYNHNLSEGLSSKSTSWRTV